MVNSHKISDENDNNKFKKIIKWFHTLSPFVWVYSGWFGTALQLSGNDSTADNKFT